MDHIERRPGRYGEHQFDPATPVLVLGGKENALSIVRSLGKLGVEVSVSGRTDCWGLYSRFCAGRYPVSRNTTPEQIWKTLLLGAAPALRQPHVIFACSDDAVEFLAKHEDALRQRHLFDNGPAGQRLALLDKQRTLEMADGAGVAAPRFWPVSRRNTAQQPWADCGFPVIVKPHNTFKFAKMFGTKFFTIDAGKDEIEQKIKLAHDAGFDVFVVEKIPGPDDLVSSYYTYIDDNGECLFHFTKRVVRRFPVNIGRATYHATDWLPETAREGLKFFANTGFRGLGNIEFKRDVRDGRLKIIEVNARFTAAQELVIRSGAPIDLIAYCAITGQPAPAFTSCTNDLRYWYPVMDFLAFLQLRNRGELSLSDWIATLRPRDYIHPLLDLSDLNPLLPAAGTFLGKAVWGRA